jgi:hypothetical protein
MKSKILKKIFWIILKIYQLFIFGFKIFECYLSKSENLINDEFKIEFSKYIGQEESERFRIIKKEDNFLL